MNIFKTFERYSKRLRSMPGGRQAGFTLLLAGIVASIALSLGASIFEIAQKEVELSAIGRDSEFAFYAADSAAECALYWDSRFQTFSNPPSTPDDCATNPSTSDPNYYGVTCDGKSACITATGINTNGATSPANLTSGTYTYTYQPNGYCAYVTVYKNFVHNVTGDSIRTFIEADGYNVPCDLISSSPDALQRAVELQY
jgi:hypothetical protein